MKRKNNIKLIISAVVIAAAALVFTGCPSATGLHNQEAASVTFVFENFGDDISGDYSIPGNWDSWDNTTLDVTMSKGNGTSNAITISTKNIQFSLVPVDSWLRTWYEKGVLQGNGSDSGTMQNFYIDDLDLSAGDITLVIDGSAGTDTQPVVQ